MFRICTDVTAPDAKEKTSGSVSMVRGVYWASDRQESESHERGLYSSASDEAILGQGRDRILDIAEKHIRRIGHRKTTVARAYTGSFPQGRRSTVPSVGVSSTRLLKLFLPSHGWTRQQAKGLLTF